MQPQGPYSPNTPPGPGQYPYPGGGVPTPQQPGSFTPPAGSPYPGQPQPAPTPYMPPANLTSNRPGENVIPPPPPRPESPYDFFMNPQKPKAQKQPAKIPGNKFVWIIGGAVGLIGILTILALARPQSVPKSTLVSVAQAQTETTRLCTEGTKALKLQPTKSFAYNCLLTQTSQSRQLVAQLGKSGAAPDGKVLGASRNPADDTKLKSAVTSSSYDETFKEVMEVQLNRQDRAIKAAAASTEANDTERKLLNDYSAATKLLIQQLESES